MSVDTSGSGECPMRDLQPHRCLLYMDERLACRLTLKIQWILTDAELWSSEFAADNPAVRSFRHKYPEGWMWALATEAHVPPEGEERMDDLWVKRSWWPMEVLLTAMRHPGYKSKFSSIAIL